MFKSFYNLPLILLTILLAVSLILPNFGLAFQPALKAPETIEEAKEMGKKLAQEAEKKLPEILKEIWEKEVLPIWQGMLEWTKSFWKTYIDPKIEIFWQKIRKIILGEIEKRKPIIKEEFEKEKEELKKEIPVVTKSLWQKFLELIK